MRILNSAVTTASSPFRHLPSRVLGPSSLRRSARPQLHLTAVDTGAFCISFTSSSSDVVVSHELTHFGRSADPATLIWAACLSTPVGSCRGLIGFDPPVSH
jgi:hypothetical protein